MAKARFFFSMSLVLFMMVPFGLGQALITGNEESTRTGLDHLTGAQRFELVGGQGDQTGSYRIALHWHMFSKTLKKWDMEISLATNYSVFDGDQAADGEEPEMHDIGITPTFTFYSHRTWQGFRPFVEGGIGFHYLTDKDFTAKDFSTNFQFGDHVGFGVQFGARNHLRLGYQFQHLSNASIRNPNPGINFHHINLGVKLK